MSSGKLQKFPFTDWSDCTKVKWIDDISRWFHHNYRKDPHAIMAILLDHVFKILANPQAGPGHRRKVVDLGTHLKDSRLFDSPPSSPHPHHRRIMQLLSMDIQSRHSHMFVLPQVNKRTLLERPDYSTLLLAAKLHESGNYGDATEAASGIARGCSLAHYIIGQNYRKLEAFSMALTHFKKALDLLDTGDCRCPFASKAVPICDHNLLRAVIYRAKAVVFRVQGESEQAEELLIKAEKVADKAMRIVLKAGAASRRARRRSRNVIWVEGGNKDAVRIAANVVSDVHYSHGYYWYGIRRYDKAEKLFIKAITALEKAHETWDSPHTRLAIVRFCQGRHQEAALKFEDAQSMCQDTIDANVEAPLSLALCSLGLRITDMLSHADPLHSDPLTDLKKAINRKPKLAKGPLKCHRQDAEHFIECQLPELAEKLVKKFIQVIDREIRRLEHHDRQSYQPPPRVRILFLSAEPDGTSRLHLNKEFRDIIEELRRSDQRDRFTLDQQLSVRPRDLTFALLKSNPEIVHFSGHGTVDGEMCLEDDECRPHPIGAPSLGCLFKNYKGHIRCVILNACYSQKAAVAISKHVDFVIGMRREVTDKSAINFSVGFYQAIGAGKCLEEAYRLGCAQVMVGGNFRKIRDLRPILIRNGSIMKER